MAFASGRADPGATGSPLLPPHLYSAGSPATPGAQRAGASLSERLAKLEDEQGLLNDKIIEQSQTKVESGSKYRVRLSGVVLLNANVTRGAVDNLDFPQMATPPETPGTSGAFSGSLRRIAK